MRGFVDTGAYWPLIPKTLRAKPDSIPLNTHYVDKTGRPVPLLEKGEPIRELL